MTTGTRYTRERLVEAAEKCGSIDEVIAFLGTRPYGHLRRYLFKRFKHFGIDVSHFRSRVHHGSGPRPSRAKLAEAVAASVSLAGTLRLLGLADTAGARNRLRRWLAEDGLITAHFLGQGHQRGRVGPTPPKTPEHVLIKHDGERRTKTVLLRRALLEIGVPQECAECGTGTVWQGKPMTLEIDHINGDWSNDRAENLRLLCPNCHATTDTWCRGGSTRSTF
ncbi:HNH endonuclease signature motif containing protein [Streptomyces sp. NPDC006510]|uniref:HNH endonuclease signature motif containing protein n=1 Tax=Streptomyces sp. NPDC006510 TaxID=3155600 RepID=UPI0033A619E4